MVLEWTPEDRPANSQGWIQDFPKGGANDGKGEWGVPLPMQSREAFAIIKN